MDKQTDDIRICNELLRKKVTGGALTPPLSPPLVLFYFSKTAQSPKLIPMNFAS